MQKKGQILYKFGMEILVGAIVVLSLLGIGYGYGKGEAILKIKIAKDIGLLIEEMYAVPDGIDAFVLYPEDTSGFVITIKDSTIDVYSQNSLDATRSSHTFVSSLKHPLLDITLKNPKNIYIGKINNEIIVAGKKPDINKLECPEIKKDMGIKSILIDSGLDQKANREKALLANSIAFSLMLKLEETFYIEHARNQDLTKLIGYPMPENLDRLKEKIQDKEAVIKVQIEEGYDQSNNLIIYYSPNSEKAQDAKAVGCNILSAIMQDDFFSSITGTSIIPKQDEIILDNNKISIILELGNFNNEKNRRLIGNAYAEMVITLAIDRAMKNEKIKD